jgi:hypothetical protein
MGNNYYGKSTYNWLIFLFDVLVRTILNFLCSQQAYCEKISTFS